MKCYVVLLCFGGFSQAMIRVPLLTTDDLRKTYEKIALQNWQPTTITYLQKFPDAPESQLLKRYISSFVARAMNNHLPQSAHIIGAEIYTARNSTPSSEQEYKYIIKGKVYGTAAVMVCTYKWDKKFKEIEEEIKKKSLK